MNEKDLETKIAEILNSKDEKRLETLKLEGKYKNLSELLSDQITVIIWDFEV